MSSWALEGRPFGRLLRESLDSIRQEVPLAHERLCDLLAERKVVVDVGGERLEISSGAERVFVDDIPADAGWQLRTDHDLVLRLVDGTTTLLEALESGALTLRGAPEELVELHEVLMAFLQGCVRAHDMAERLERYRTEVMHRRVA